MKKISQEIEVILDEDLREAYDGVAPVVEAPSLLMIQLIREIRALNELIKNKEGK